MIARDYTAADYSAHVDARDEALRLRAIEARNRALVEAARRRGRLTYNLRPGWRVAQIDRSRFYVTNDLLDPAESATIASRTYRDRALAERQAAELNRRDADEAVRQERAL